jgi:hypothetical protein
MRRPHNPAMGIGYRAWPRLPQATASLLLAAADDPVRADTGSRPTVGGRVGPVGRSAAAMWKAFPGGSGPRHARALDPHWVRAATVAHGHQRSPGVTKGSKDPQVAGPLAQAAAVIEAGDSDCGPEGRGFESPRSPCAPVRGTPDRDATQVVVRVAQGIAGAITAMDQAFRPHVTGSGPSTLTTVAPTPPTRMTMASPPSAATDSRWIRCAGM